MLTSTPQDLTGMSFLRKSIPVNFPNCFSRCMEPKTNSFPVFSNFRASVFSLCTWRTIMLSNLFCDIFVRKYVSRRLIAPNHLLLSALVAGLTVTSYKSLKTSPIRSFCPCDNPFTCLRTSLKISALLAPRGRVNRSVFSCVSKALGLRSSGQRFVIFSNSVVKLSLLQL